MAKHNPFLSLLLASVLLSTSVSCSAVSLTETSEGLTSAPTMTVAPTTAPVTTPTTTAVATTPTTTAAATTPTTTMTTTTAAPTTSETTPYVVSTAPTAFEKDENGNLLSPDGRRGSELDTPYVKNGVILVNKQHHVNGNYVPTTTDSGPTVALEVAEPLAKLIAAAAADGIYLIADSNYRSYDTQSAIFWRYAGEMGEREANRISAYPGQSEHQTGLVVDFADENNGWASYETDFGDLESGRWLAANSYKYGFILRYLKDKESITGYSYEPWHFRYVGLEVAAAIGPNPSITLEEYLGE